MDYLLEILYVGGARTVTPCESFDAATALVAEETKAHLVYAEVRKLTPYMVNGHRCYDTYVLYVTDDPFYQDYWRKRSPTFARPTPTCRSMYPTTSAVVWPGPTGTKCPAPSSTCPSLSASCRKVGDRHA